MARVLIVDDQPMVLKCLKSALAADGHDVATVSAGDMALKLVGFQTFDVIITDYAMPGMDGIRFLEAAHQKSPGVPVIMVTGYGTPETAIEAMEHGAFDYLTKPFSLDALRATVAAALEYTKARDQIPRIFEADSTAQPFPHVIAASSAMKAVCSELATHAAKDEPVLFQGEPGTGKETLARALHVISKRSAGVFERIDCSRMREGGSVGSLLAYCRAGTMFFREIGDMPKPLQKEMAAILLLRQFRPSEKDPPVTLDTLLLFSTSRRIDRMVHDGVLDPDLAQRLQTVVVTVPPLRERPEDLRLLIGQLLRQWVSDAVLPIEPDALLVLENYPWPGNLPELEETLRNATLLSGGKRIELKHLPRGIVRMAETGERENVRRVDLNQFRGRVVKSFLQNMRQEYERLLSKIEQFTVQPTSAPSQKNP